MDDAMRPSSFLLVFDRAILVNLHSVWTGDPEKALSTVFCGLWRLTRSWSFRWLSIPFLNFSRSRLSFCGLCAD